MNTKHHHLSPLHSEWFLRHRGSAMMVVVALAFLVLNVFTPLYHDDFVYKFMFEGGTVNYDHPIQSVGDIFLSQVEHYHSVNGRSIVHFLVQLFTGLLGKPVFNIFNVICFCGFIFLLQRHTPRDARFCVSTTLTMVLVLLLPRFKDTFLWMTGSINYLWSATAALLFLLMYEKQRQPAISWRLLPLLIAAFLLGWTHEGITLPLSASLVLIDLFHLKKSHGREQGLWLALAYLAGGCVIALAPGTIARSGIEGGLTPSVLGLKVITGFTVLAKLRIIYLALLASAVAWFACRDTVKKVVSRKGYLLLAMLLSLGIIFASGQTLTRVAFGLELFAMIYLLDLLWEWWPRQGEALQRWCTVGLTAGLLAFYALLLYHIIPSWQESQRLLTQIEQTDASGGIIGTNEHDAGCLNDFICPMLTRDATPNAMNYDPHGWPASIAAACHRDSLVFLPQGFLDDLKTHPERYTSLDLNTPWEFYIQRIDEDAVIDSVTFQLVPNDFSDIPALFRPIARRMNRYTSTTATARWVTLNLYGHRYLLIKKDHGIQHRVLVVNSSPTPL